MMEQYLAHSELLSNLINQITTIDFEAIAFPEKNKVLEEIRKITAVNKNNSGKNDTANDEILQGLYQKLNTFKIKQKQVLVIAIEQIIELARLHSWNLCKNNGLIYIYNGAFWKHIENEEFQNFLGKAAEKLGIDELSAKHFSFKEQLFKQFLSAAYLPRPTLSKGEVLVNLQNGTLVISPDKVYLKNFDPNDFLTYLLPFNYDTEAKCPLFNNYLAEVLPDINLQNILMEYLGYLFIQSSTLKLEKALLLYGSGANGKSVFFEVTTALLGQDNISNYSLQSLTNENGYYRAKLANKLVNYASEINGNLEASIFKQLASGEPVEARLPYGEPFSLQNYAKLIFNSNELPKEVEHTPAFFRRFLMVPFNVTIPEHKQDKELANKIISSELSGVMNLVILGLKRLLDQKRFTQSVAADNLNEYFKKQSDTVQLFLEEEQYKKSFSNYIQLKDVYSAYRTYCYENGYKPGSNRTLSERLKNAGYEVERKSTGIVVYIEKQSYVPIEESPF
ncbi:phage/plasmid primase, P4 family [Mucilaginibacter sp. PAMB04168]|uniref:DNA primase family protein n=1 Tax=Mucilaginibacter sp. PAMB04168 TaxID=3138567 RepID=UPI0031F61C2B